MAVLSDMEIQRELKNLPGWTMLGDKISKIYEFKDFVEAIGFVDMVSKLAEQANHHPDIDIRWNKVTLVLSTHSENGITQKDILLAKKVDTASK
jgi:4a-hydroxytetrahydrobiopterin dehydratase